MKRGNLKRNRHDESGRLLSTQVPYMEGGVMRIVRYTYPERGAAVMDFDRPATAEEVAGHEAAMALNAAAAALRDPTYVSRILAGDLEAQLTQAVATGRVKLDVARDAGWTPPQEKLASLPADRPAAKTTREAIDAQR